MILMLGIALIVPAVASATGRSARFVGNVYAMDNNPEGNRLVVYGRFSNGALRRFGSVGTGGLGAGDNADADPLGSQESIIVSENGRTLYSVNAGSNTISIFHLTRLGRPILIQRVSSEGTFPVSLTTDGELLYVLNSGDNGTIAGYNIGKNGRLELIDASVTSLGTGQVGVPVGGLRNLAPGDIAFDTHERRLLIPFGNGTELGEGLLLSFTVEDDGTLGLDSGETTSPGRLPFSVDFTQNGVAIIAEALGTADGDPTGGSVSSVRFDGGASLEVRDSVDLGQATTCWVRVAHQSNLVFTSNTAAGSLSSLRASRNGDITLVDAEAATGIGGPIDFDLTEDDQFLYVTTSSDGGVAGFRVNPDSGALRSIGLYKGLPTFEEDGFAPQGLAIR